MSRLPTLLRTATAALMALLMASCAQSPALPPPHPQAVAEITPEPPAPPPPLLPDYPPSYRVQRGDTLWGVAARFLADPWRWPELWQNSSDIDNPHLIYPGDIITLYHVDGLPRLTLVRPAVEGDRLPEAQPPVTESPPRYPTVRLSPQIRSMPLDRAIPPLPMEVIQPFLSRPRVTTSLTLERAPYVVAAVDEHLIAGNGMRLYARGISNPAIGEYILVRAGTPYRNPADEKDILGHEAIYLGHARLERLGDPATLVVTRGVREVLAGDRLLPADDDRLERNYTPRAPSQPMSGQIIAAEGGYSMIGQYQTVVIDLGRQSGIEQGHVLAISQPRGTLRDPFDKQQIELPPERAGLLMVFRVFDRVSYALVMRATRPVAVGNRLTLP
jgi:hypothetical protein